MDCADVATDRAKAAIVNNLIILFLPFEVLNAASGEVESDSRNVVVRSRLS